MVDSHIRPVTPEVASSNLVAPANFDESLSLSVAGFFSMAHFVCILMSEKTGTYYVGHTQDLNFRLERHNQRRVKYTKSKRPWDLVYFEEYPDRPSAMTKEEDIKKRKSEKFIDSLVRTSRQSRREGREFESRRPRQ